MSVAPEARVEYFKERSEIVCSGSWTLEAIDKAEKYLNSLVRELQAGVILNGEQIDKVDSAGAMLIFQLLYQLEQTGKPIKSYKFQPECQSLLELIQQEQEAVLRKWQQDQVPGWLYTVGKWTFVKLNEVLQFVAFMGEFVVTCYNVVRQPRRISWRSVLVVIEQTGYQALPIVALLIFLVGVVVTYQIALQLSTYGADIFIVDVTGIIVLREFGPLITAIIAAGRTSTAFTAQIGTMKVNEEIDALATFGVVPYERLVIPKFVALLVSLSLLAVWADIFGVMGAMVTSKIKLGIDYVAFIERFHTQVQMRHFLVGLIKMPVFAVIIALVGCFQGFQVAQSADSVGNKTTKSAVQSIFLIIIADAIFSVAFSIQGL